MRKAFILAAAAIFGFTFSAKAQTNLQTFYDAGRGYATTTFEMFKSDNWGNTFFFIDHYYASKENREASNARSAINGSYFEIERALNFWQDTKLGGLSAHLEYDGSTWGNGVFCVGANYFLHSQDFNNTLTLYLMYEHMNGYGTADVPVKFSAVWGMQDLFGVAGLRFNGFIDVWGNNSAFVEAEDGYTETKFSILTEPQIWYNVGQHFGCENLHIGGEIELSYNFAGHKGFMCNPCIGTKWVF